DLTYLGEDPNAYLPFYEKKTNEEENDYSDLITLTRTLSATSEAAFPSVMEGLVDVEEWLRYFAAETVLNNQDGAISTDTGEDYFLYRRPSDGRWVLIPWDQNENFQDPTDAIYRMGIAAVRRLVLHPAFAGRYQALLLEALDGPFAEGVMASRLDAARGAFSSAELDEIAGFVPARQRAIRYLLPRELVAGVEPRYLVRTGDSWRFFRGTREPSAGTTAWTGVSFSDGAWEEGPGGFGYGDGDDRTTLLDMEDGYTTVYLRHAFTLDEPGSIATLTLSVRFDDGFVLYLNGAEVVRRDVTGAVSFDSEADADHEAGSPAAIDLSSFRGLLRTGKNVIAAVGVNASIASSDLTLDPEVFAPAQGSGCGSRLFARSAALSLGGTSPVPETASVRVNGLAASYDPLTGRWHLPVAVAAGLNSF
ncbi:MAG: CotH kinase family protein, partial [Thermoanaerobaculia bacterium]